MSRIMLVDDEPVLVELYSQMLTVGGHVVVATASDGGEAVATFDGTLPPPDVVLMDHRMPGKNGLTATREITDAHPGTKVLMVTADFTIQPRVETEGACGLLEKPFTMDQLLAAIDLITGGRSHHGPLDRVATAHSRSDARPNATDERDPF